jgi:DNA-binding XRE family transcriptional regulator
MASTGTKVAMVEAKWTPSLIKRLRGKRTQTAFGELLGVPKNTVWRWESGRTSPDTEHAKALTQMAAKQGFLKDWKLVGSMELMGSLEQGSKSISAKVMKALLRSANELTA